jgi:hypothetical protein
MDVSDIIEYNVGLLNPNDLDNSWFCLKKDDPTAGFAYDASIVAGHTYPEVEVETDSVGKHYILWGTRPSNTACWGLNTSGCRPK